MITRKLTCALTEDDILYRGRELADAEHHYRELEAEKKEALAEFKESMDAADFRIQELTLAIRTKKEERDVECIIEEDLAHYKKLVIRTDTQEIVETYEMTEKERQGSLL